jgi:diaminopimelate decarboxylase
LATPDQIIYANPIKTPSYIGTAKERKVRRMTFDCVEELEKVKRVYPEAE